MHTPRPLAVNAVMHQHFSAACTYGKPAEVEPWGEDSGCHPADWTNWTCDLPPLPPMMQTCDGQTLAALRVLAAHPKCVAIGECGLDFNRNFSPQDVQEIWFEKQVWRCRHGHFSCHPQSYHIRQCSAVGYACTGGLSEGASPSAFHGKESVEQSAALLVVAQTRCLSFLLPLQCCLQDCLDALASMLPLLDLNCHVARSTAGMHRSGSARSSGATFMHIVMLHRMVLGAEPYLSPACILPKTMLGYLCMMPASSPQ